LAVSAAPDVVKLVPTGGLLFPALPVDQLTTLVSFAARAGTGPKACSVRFALILPCTGMPADRIDRVTASLVEQCGFTRLLALLLAEDDEDAGARSLLGILSESRGRARGEAAEEGLPLLEELLRTAARRPERLAEIRKLVEELSRTEEGRKALPEGFDLLWKPLAEAMEVGR
jgi:hypothetical protein